MICKPDYLKRTDVRDFFNDYGTIEASCMCLGIACGVPFDAGAGVGSGAPEGSGGGGGNENSDR